MNNKATKKSAIDMMFYTRMKNRMKELKHIEYDGCKYNDTWDLCNAVGIDRSVFVWVYFNSSLSLKDAIDLSRQIENV